MDFLKMVGGILFSILSLVCIVAGTINDAFLLGLIGMGICIFLCIKLFASVSNKTWDMLADIEENEKQQRTNNGYKCPNCGKNAGHKIDTINKAVSVGMLGLASDKIGKTYKCENCDYMW